MNGEARRFDPAKFSTFRFTGRSIDPDGLVTLGYALDDELEFVERFEVPIPAGARVATERVQGLVALLHWIAGVSYYKTSLPQTIEFAGEPPLPAAARLLEVLYSEGLAELALRNDLPSIPRPAFAARSASRPATSGEREIDRVLVPIGGGKDSAVALEIVRRAGLDLSLFSVDDAPAMARTATVAGLPRLVCRRRIDPKIDDLNRRGALNGHIPITSIVSAVALLTAELNGLDAVAMANERSASAPNLLWHGVAVNHQFSKSLRAEQLLSEAVGELDGPRIFSVLRPASELAVARAFARMSEYHDAFGSCNRQFRLDRARRVDSWCRECDKCRFVFLILAPFLAPSDLERIFGAALLEDASHYEGFARLAGVGGHKPFECVGEIEESVAAIRLLADDARWRDQAVVRRLSADVLPRFETDDTDLDRILQLRDDGRMPAGLTSAVEEFLAL